MNFGDGIDWNAEGRRAAKASTGPATNAEIAIRAAKHCPPPGRVLDAGCNIGRFAPPFINVGYAYVGVDQAKEALDIAREQNPGVEFVYSFLWDMTYEGVFDVAFTNAVLQHNTHPEKGRIVERIAAAVRKGGVFLMQESTVLETTNTQLRHEQWISLVEHRGFKLIETWHPNNEYAIDDAYAFRRV